MMLHVLIGWLFSDFGEIQVDGRKCSKKRLQWLSLVMLHIVFKLFGTIFFEQYLLRLTMGLI